MDRLKQVWQRMMSLPAKVGRSLRPLLVKFAGFVKQASSQPVRSRIPFLGIVIGAVTFGLWWRSFEATLFAGISLSFLAGIYRNSKRALAAIRQLETKVPLEEVEARPEPLVITQPVPEDSEAVKEAVQYLQPWLANEVSLTEEGVRDRCAVLVDSVVERARQLTTTA
jgi:hypothetical protein